ncbi:CLUMA_CG011539, isoform A [Clunio marinus]|uniref:CLUMA_CG011539, isoform A n=1 Tax=Clunio marinus TaxID=568069 RepID=A0A1J1ID11_9DIPT|nr:CLUMA_CG011539, isoform A [Clunio marinus]
MNGEVEVIKSEIRRFFKKLKIQSDWDWMTVSHFCRTVPVTGVISINNNHQHFFQSFNLNV